MNRDEIINEILIAMSKVTSIYLENVFQAKYPEIFRNVPEMHHIIDLMVNEDLIEKISFTGYNHKLTPHGLSVLENGGWLNYKKSENERIINERNLQFKKDQKLINDERISRWQVKTFWPLFIIALVGGVCGIISLFLQLCD